MKDFPIETRQYSALTALSYLIGPLQIIASHFGALILLLTGLSWGAVVWLTWLYVIRMLATTTVYHRLLTHKSYKAHFSILWLGCLLAASAGQMGPSWWKAHHLAHHKHVDQVLDPHSPYAPPPGKRGFYWSQGGWLLSSQFFPTKLPMDVEKDLRLKAIDRFHFVPFVLLGMLSYGIGGLEYFGAFCLSTTLLFHGVQTVNSLAHLFGDQPFITDDHSRNNWLVALLAAGEGWHNLHHAFQLSCRHGITIRAGKVVYLPDPTFSLIQVLERLKLASKLRLPTERDLLARAQQTQKDQLPKLASLKS